MIRRPCNERLMDTLCNDLHGRIRGRQSEAVCSAGLKLTLSSPLSAGMKQAVGVEHMTYPFRVSVISTLSSERLDSPQFDNSYETGRLQSVHWSVCMATTGGNPESTPYDRGRRSLFAVSCSPTDFRHAVPSSEPPASCNETTLHIQDLRRIQQLKSVKGG